MLIGIIGKPSSGKSTFFKALTLADVEIASYPFTTISPNRGFGFVSTDCVDKEFNKQCNPREGFCIEHKRFIPIDVLDVAGLVPGAYEGKGKGNQFFNVTGFFVFAQFCQSFSLNLADALAGNTKFLAYFL